jgi:serine protease Do
LVGLGSLYIRDAIAEGMFSPGNIFVPIDLLEPIQRDLVTKGVRSSGLNPWMGITPDDSNGYVAILRVSKDGPADQAGLRAGDFITAVAGKEVRTLRDLYRTAWGLGSAGTRIPIEVERDGRKFPLVIKSIDRTTFFKKPDGL